MIAIGIVLAALFPLVYHDPYYMTIIVTGEIVLILNISWNFVLGMAGVWNFGQLAIYALGAYGSGWLMLHHSGIPVPIAIVLGGVFSGVISVLLAFPTLRLFGIYTSLLTFSFAQVVQYVAVNNPHNLTGGSFGFPEVPGLFPDLGQSDYLRAYYWVCAAVIVVSCASRTWGSPCARSATRPPTRRPAASTRVRRGWRRSACRGSWPGSPVASTSRSSSRSRRARWA
jgi:branched-chain amino acid transport system permease protein